MGIIPGWSKLSRSRIHSAVAATRMFEALEPRQLLTGVAMDFTPDLYADAAANMRPLDGLAVTLSAQPSSDTSGPATKQSPALGRSLPASPATTVSIPDANLLAAIRSAL